MSWYQLLDTLKLAHVEFEYWASNPPMACPRCGEPLTLSPEAAETTRFCRYDGFYYPRDWVRPEML